MGIFIVARNMHHRFINDVQNIVVHYTRDLAAHRLIAEQFCSLLHRGFAAGPLSKAGNNFLIAL